MLKSISIAAIALAMTAGIASAQSTTDAQRGAGLFDQGGLFYNQSRENLDRRSTASIDRSTTQSTNQNRSDARSSRPAEQNRATGESKNIIQWGGQNPFYRN